MKAFAVTVLLCGSASAAVAQSLEQRPQRFLADMPAVAHVDAGAWCLTQLPLGEETREPRCRVESFQPLGSSGATQWHVGKYQRSAILIGVEPEDTIAWDEIVLFTAGDADRVSPVWHFWTERWAEFLREVRAEPRAEGLLIELLICLNGTGGCARDYLLANDARLAIVDVPFVDALRARLPEGRTLHKGVTLDLNTLRGTWPVAAQGDANCCPSYAFDYSVRLEGARMVLVDATLRPAQPRTPADHLLALLPALRDDVTLGSWVLARPEDRVTPYGPRLAESTYEDWCARAETETEMATSVSVRRTAYFYPPAVPDPPGLPMGVSAERLSDGCRLGLVWIEVVHPDSTRAHDLAGRTQTAITTELGVADTSTRPYWAGSASWRGTSFWRVNGTTIVSATTSRRTGPRGEVPAGRRVIVAATVPAVAGVVLEWERQLARGRSARRAGDRRGALQTRLEEMLALADLGGAEAAMRSWIARLDALEDGITLSETEREAFASAIDVWFASASSVPADRRAAALVAADLLVQITAARVAGFSLPEQAAVRDRMAAHGARFDYAPIGGVHIYMHDWLKEALRMDSGGRAGEIAFLALMEMGFETSATCTEQGGNGFRAVIARGEEFLRTRSGSAVANEVRFLVAEAYSDIVRLVNGGNYQAIPELPAQPEEEEPARRRAVELYVAAFERAGGSMRARESWPNAWRLMAGLTPMRTYFYCVYD